MSLDPQFPAPSAQKATHWPSALQFGLSLLAIAGLVIGAGLFLMVGVFSAMMDADNTNPLSALLTASALFGVAVLLIPSAYYGLYRLMDKPARDTRFILTRMHPALWLLLFPFILLIGFAASRVETVSWLVLPLLHVLAIALPVAWLVSIAVRGLPLGSSQRVWGVFGVGLSLGPLLISILEGVAVIALIGVAVVYVMGRPELMAELEALGRLNQFGQPNETELMEALSPFILRPGVILGVLAIGSLVVPLIEEALKPIGVWFLAGKPVSAAAGFAAGALSGAGFALTESMLLSSNGGEWAVLVLVRMGTGAIHILTTALTGWALALAWKRRRFLLLAVTYLTVVLIHGLWNGLTILTVFAGLARSQGGADALPLISRLAVGAPLALVLLAVGAVALLAFFNRRLKRTAPQQALSARPAGSQTIEERSVP